MTERFVSQSFLEFLRISLINIFFSIPNFFFVMFCFYCLIVNCVNGAGCCPPPVGEKVGAILFTFSDPV